MEFDCTQPFNYYLPIVRGEIFSTVNGVPLHIAFHYHQFIFLIWLKFCWKWCKIASQPSIHQCWQQRCSKILASHPASHLKLLIYLLMSCWRSSSKCRWANCSCFSLISSILSKVSVPPGDKNNDTFQHPNMVCAVNLTLPYRETHKRVIGKQFRPRSDATLCGIWSESTLFAYWIFHR